MDNEPYSQRQAPAWMELTPQSEEVSFADRVHDESRVKTRMLEAMQQRVLQEGGGAGTPSASGETPNGAPRRRGPTQDAEGAGETSAAYLFEEMPEPYPHTEEYQRVIISELEGEEADPDVVRACEDLSRGLALRSKWIALTGKSHRIEEGRDELVAALQPRSMDVDNVRWEATPKFRRRSQPLYVPPFRGEEPGVPETLRRLEGAHAELVRGVFCVFVNEEARGNGRRREPTWQPPTAEEFFADFFALRGIVTSGPVKSAAYKRLKLLEGRFELHTMLNGDRELQAQKSVPHRDFYNVRKVDTHVHHSACMNQKHLLRYIKHKLKYQKDEIVSFRDGRFMTLTEVFDSLRLSAYDLSIDTLDMHANNTFHRFDRFNLKYNPAGQSRLREIFLKTHNLLGGQYLAEVTRQVCDDLAKSKYQLAEWRVSIYGRGLSEWDRLARWFYLHRLAHPCVRWMIQIPRLFHIYKRSGTVDNFGEMLSNIFTPLFDVTIDPSVNPPLHAFLKTIVAFDSVDDESKPEPVRPYPGRPLPAPEDWDNEHNPPYSYWTFYLYANIAALNHLRARRGLNTFAFRPHAGEAGDLDHLVATYLCADEINHGILLRKLPGLHYLYYLSQVGVAVSPLSNNKLFLDYNRNPFPKYFAQGLNVSLSTDDPLMLHYTQDALLEEYSVAAQVWRLSATDLCEIARNSVLQSGWEHSLKKHFLGPYWRSGAQGNDITLTNVPDVRLKYRKDVLDGELAWIERNCRRPQP